MNEWNEWMKGQWFDDKNYEKNEWMVELLNGWENLQMDDILDEWST